MVTGADGDSYESLFTFSRLFGIWIRERYGRDGMVSEDVKSSEVVCCFKRSSVAVFAEGLTKVNDIL